MRVAIQWYPCEKRIDPVQDFAGAAGQRCPGRHCGRDRRPGEVLARCRGHVLVVRAGLSRPAARWPMLAEQASPLGGLRPWLRLGGACHRSRMR